MMEVLTMVYVKMNSDFYPVEQFPQATHWDVADVGELYLKDNHEKIVATFARGLWAGAWEARDERNE